MDNKDQIDRILEQLDRISEKVERLIEHINKNPIPPTTTSTTCHVCGMVWEGVMSYSCMNMNCPVQPKVTSNIG